MSIFSSRLFKSLFPRFAECALPRRAALNAQLTARRRQALSVHPRLELLEDRIVPDAYTFVLPQGVTTGNWSNAANWADSAGNQGVPGAHDQATISGGLTCIVDESESASNVQVEGGTLLVNKSLTIAPGGDGPGGLSVSQGGSATVSAPVNATQTVVFDAGVLTIGSSNDPSADATLTTGELEMYSGNHPGDTVNVGGPNGGSTGTIDAQTVDMTGGGTLNIGGGMFGTVDVSGTMTGGANVTGGGSTLHAGILNGNGINVTNGGGIEAGSATIGNAYIDAGVILGTGSLTEAQIYNGPASGNVAGGNWTLSYVDLNNDATLGADDFYIDGPVNFNEKYLDNTPKLILQNNGTTTLGSIGGSGSITLSTEFDWQGGTLGGLTGGGFLIGNPDTEQPGTFLVYGSDQKTLSTTLTNFGLNPQANTADFDGTGNFSISSNGEMINQAPSNLPMELSLPGFGGGGLFENEGYLTLGGSNTIEIGGLIDNTPAGVIAGGGVTLSLPYNGQGICTLSGSINIGGAITMNGNYTASGLTMTSGSGTTIGGTLTLDGNDYLGNAILNYGSTINGGGQLYTQGYFDWEHGTVTGITMTVETTSTLNLLSDGTMDSNLYVYGTLEWTGGSYAFNSGTEVDIEKDALFDFEGGFGSVSILVNDGTIELGTNGPLMAATFSQGSDGTLQENIASGSSSGMLDVTGSATLGGTLDVNLVGGYQPPSGTSFAVLNYGSYSGQFATINPSGWTAQYNSTSLDLVSP